MLLLSNEVYSIRRRRAGGLATAKALTGVPIDHFAEVEFSGFGAIADGSGVVTLCATHAIVYQVRPSEHGVRRDPRGMPSGWVSGSPSTLKRCPWN